MSRRGELSSFCLRRVTFFPLAKEGHSAPRRGELSFVSDGSLSFPGERGVVPRPGAGSFPLSPTGHFLSLAKEELFRAPARGAFLFYASGGLFSFSSERKEEKKRRQKLRFWISLRGFTYSLSRWNKPRERCAVETSPKYCIVPASWSAAAFALKCRSSRFYRG